MTLARRQPNGLTGRNRVYFGDVLRWGGLVGLATITVLRCVVLFAPQVVFDTDPAMKGSMPLGGFGPAGSLLLDGLLLLACALALLGEWLKERGTDWMLLTLAFIAMPIVLWHGAHDAGNLWRGTTWAAGAISCATVAHLARDKTMRAVLIALLAAVAVPLLARGAAQMTFEHADTLRFYEQHRAEILRDKGWAPDSPAALIFERRLHQPQPLGWFTTTNIYASLVGLSLIVFAGSACAAFRAKLQGGWSAAMILAALACVAALVLTGSKGAILAVMLGLGLFVWLKIGTSKTYPGLMVIAMIALALLAVIARGSLLTEGFAGEKSLLFRWHYLVASMHMFTDRPWLGVGPDGFQEAYTLYRVPRNPEEVASAHSMFVDWLCTLGIAGAAWIALVLAMVWRSCTGPAAIAADLEGIEHANSESREAPAPLSPAVILAIVAVAALSAVPALVLELTVADPLGITVQVLGASGLVAVAILISFIILNGERRAVRAAVIAAVAMLLVHGQIEMTFQQPGSVVWAMSAVGLIGGARCGKSRRNAVASVSFILFISAAALWILAAGAWPAYLQQRTMIAAANSLRLIAAHPNDLDLALWRRSQEAPARLQDAYLLWPADVHPLEAAVIQLQIAAANPKQSQPAEVLSQAREIIERAVLQHNKSTSLALAVQVNVQLAQLTSDATCWNAAIRSSQELTRRDPHGLGAWRRLGDVLWMHSDHAEAAAAYGQALKCDRNFALDELKRLSEHDRKMIEQRIAEAAR